MLRKKLPQTALSTKPSVTPPLRAPMPTRNAARNWLRLTTAIALCTLLPTLAACSGQPTQPSPDKPGRVKPLGPEITQELNDPIYPGDPTPANRL